MSDDPPFARPRSPRVEERVSAHSLSAIGYETPDHTLEEVGQHSA